MNFSVGGLVIVGGAMGYLKKGSKVSLLAGLTFGGLLVGSGIMISGDKQYEGHVLASSASGIMALAMGQRFLSTGKFMPAGLVATLGAACCAYNVKKAMEWAPTKGGTLQLLHVKRNCIGWMRDFLLSISCESCPSRLSNLTPLLISFPFQTSAIESTVIFCRNKY